MISSLFAVNELKDLNVSEIHTRTFTGQFLNLRRKNIFLTMRRFRLHRPLCFDLQRNENRGEHQEEEEPLQPKQIQIFVLLFKMTAALVQV